MTHAPQEETRVPVRFRIGGEAPAEVCVYADAERLAEGAAARFGELARRAVEERGRFTVALSGGRTPVRLYGRLAQGPPGEPLPWADIHVFWGDERAVPPDHPDSNFRSADEALLSKVPIPGGNVHRIRAEEGDVDDAAAAYERDLRAFFAGVPRFDLVLLGLGPEGHTASLFPESEALRERDRLAVATRQAELGVRRVTLTVPVLSNARTVMFLVSGARKAEALARVVGSEAAALPAGMVRPRHGTLLFLVDRAAAGSLPTPPRGSREK